MKNNQNPGFLLSQVGLVQGSYARTALVAHSICCNR